MLVSADRYTGEFFAAPSPDGRTIAFTAPTDTSTALFVRRIDAARPELLAGTEGAALPFWSPDSRTIAFYAGGRLKRVSATGGAVQNITDAPNMAGGTWNDDGVIVFAASGVLNRTSAGGGERIPISVRDESKQETAHQSPHFLPDGKRFLYLAWSGQQADRALYLASLDSKDRVRLFTSQSKAVYASPGYLLFHRDGTLFVQPFDADSATLTGEQVRIADEISYDALNGNATFDVSGNNRLVYYAGGGPAVNRQFLWFDRTGRSLGGGGHAGVYTANFDLSPDGAQIAVAQRNRETLQYDIWLLDWARGLPTRFTFDPALTANGNVVWSPDGRIAFASERAGNRDIFEKRANRVGAEMPLLATPTDEWPEHWSADGRYLAYGRNTTQGASGSGALFVLSLFGDRTSITVADTPFNEDEPRFSHDGQWLAYNSNESGTHQVYLVSFPGIDQKRQISTDGGVQPRWRRDGTELYYLALDGRIMAVDLRIDSQIESGIPRPLFNTRLSVDPLRDQFAVTADGQRFLVQVPVVDGPTTPISVILNWTQSLRR
jgi:Tol biopolymer transport system component